MVEKDRLIMITTSHCRTPRPSHNSNNKLSVVRLVGRPLLSDLRSFYRLIGRTRVRYMVLG